MRRRSKDFTQSFIWRYGSMAFCVGFLLGISSCATVIMDNAVSAAEGRSSTLFLSGPDQEPLRGRVYVEVREGANPTQAITMHFPAVSCDRPSCIGWQLIRLDGSFGESGSVSKGSDRVVLPLSKVVGNENPFDQHSDGEYQAIARVYFKGNDGEEHLSVMRGFIRIVVLRTDYSHIGCGDPAVAWETKLDQKGLCQIHWTSKLRSAKCGVCPKGSS